MKTTEITVLEEVELNNPIFIEALPGLGHVGKLAADHMIDELGATKFAEVYSSNITIKIKETGIQKIFFDGETCYSTRPKFPYPDEVYINDEIQNNISAKYNFTKEDNVIKLVWYESRENWGCLFKGCNKITEMDFSEFDFSKIIRGNMMFMFCKALT